MNPYRFGKTFLLFIILFFISCQHETEQQKEREKQPVQELDTYSKEALEFFVSLNRINLAYSNHPNNPFLPDTLKTLQNILDKIEKVDLSGAGYLKPRAYRLKVINDYNEGKREGILEQYKFVETLLEKIPNGEMEKAVNEEKLHIYNLLALFYENDLKKYGLAINYQQKFFEAADQQNLPRAMTTGQTNLGILNNRIRYFERAEKAFEMSGKIWSHLKIEKIDSLNFIGYHYGKAQFYKDFAIDWKRRGNVKKANSYIEKATSTSRIIKNELDKLNQKEVAYYRGATFHLLGTTYLQKENNLVYADSILWFYKKSKSIFNKKPIANKSKIINLHGDIAVAYSLKNNYPAAMKSLDQGYKLLTGMKKWEGKNFPSLPKYQIIDYILLSAQKAKSLQMLGLSKNHSTYLKKSLNQYLHTLDFLEKIRVDYNSQIAQETNSFYFSDYTAEAIKVAKKLLDLTKEEKYGFIAFELSERNKSFSLRNTATLEFAQLNYVGEQQTLWEREQNFKRQIIHLEEKYVEDKSVRDSLIAIRLAYDKFIDGLRNAPKDSKRYIYYLDRFDDYIPTVPEIQKNIISDNSAIIEYQWDGNEALAFVITKDTFKLIPLEIATDFQKTIYQYSESLKEATLQFTKNSIAIYDLIFRPLESYVKGKEHLIIIRDKGFNRIIFQTLLTENSPTTNKLWKDQPYLFKDFNIVYKYSLASSEALKKLQENKPQPTNEIALFVAYSKNNHTSKDWGCGGDTKLPKMKNAMVKRKGTKKIENATPALFTSKGKNSKIVHFILHGCFFKENHPLTNYLQFNPEGEDDGKLTVGDIYNLELNNRLIVLSSCHAAEGVLRGNEGLQSIARAFSFAGCPTVVAGLDKLEDKSTSELMTYFYDNLEKGQAIDEALRKAKLTYLENTSNEDAHPRFWANLICIGDTAPLF